MNRRAAIAALVGLPAVTTIARAALAPADVIVIETKCILSDQARARVAEIARAVWPGHKVVVLDEGLTLKIVRADAV